VCADTPIKLELCGPLLRTGEQWQKGLVPSLLKNIGAGAVNQACNPTTWKMKRGLEKIMVHGQPRHQVSDIQSQLCMVAHACYPSNMGGCGRKIAQAG
jgi:hypothetical protein